MDPTQTALDTATWAITEKPGVLDLERAILRHMQVAEDTERRRCATIMENLHRVLSGPRDDPDPKYRTDEAHSHLERSLTEIALEAIRNP